MTSPVDQIFFGQSEISFQKKIGQSENCRHLLTLYLVWVFEVGYTTGYATHKQAKQNKNVEQHSYECLKRVSNTSASYECLIRVPVENPSSRAAGKEIDGVPHV